MYLEAFYKVNHKNGRRGVTLVEILVVIAIVGVLSGILVAGVQKVRESAQVTAKTSGARSLIQAFLMTPMENGGKFMKGYGESDGTLYPPNSPPISASSEPAKRYPWRIAPLLEDNIETIYVGADREYYERFASNSSYTASLHPSFGINSVFVGGHYDGRNYSPGYKPGPRSRDQSTYPRNFWVLSPSDAVNPSMMIVFASSLYTPPADYGEPVGFYRVNAPNSPASGSWGSYNPEIPANMGFVSLETGGKAVVAQLDGSVELLNEEELRDMRRWSNQAALFDDPDFSEWNRQ